MKTFSLTVVLLSLGTILTLSTANAVVQYGYSTGFEPTTFSTGALDGQDGWIAGGGGGGAMPMVVASPDPVEDTQSVKLHVDDVQGQSSNMDIANNLSWVIAAKGTLTVSFDIYRSESKQNLWWWLFDAGEPTYGLQWDLPSQTLPHGWNPGAGATSTILGRFVNMTMTWDFNTNQAYSWYDNVLVDNGIPITNMTSVTGWHIGLSHDAGDGSGADTAYIDNFSMTAVPEPATIAGITVALGGLIASSIRRRK